MKFILTATARISLENILEFLRNKWTEMEILSLQRDIENFKETILDRIVTHQYFENNTKVQFMLLANKQVKVYYQIIEDEVVIKLFWHCKQNPESLIELLR